MSLTVNRKDLIGEYIGQTELKTLSILERCLNENKNLIIEESYAICFDDRDLFGINCLQTIVVFLKSNNLCITFTGDSTLVNENIHNRFPSLRVAGPDK